MKTILVSGGNRGIGLEICRQLAAKGNRILVGSRSIVRGEKVADALGENVYPIQLDVTSPESVKNVAERIRSEFGALDVLINNAAIMPGSSSFDQVDENEVRRTLETNFYGPMRLAQALIPLLRKSRNGKIINISSGMGSLTDGGGSYAAYRISKTALNGFTRFLAGDLAGSVEVHAVCPGWVRTDMGGDSAPRSVAQGADTPVWLVGEENVSSGHFWRDREIIPW